MVSTFMAFAIFGQSNQIKSDGLEVGPGKQFARIEDAVDRAKSGDVISVFPSPDGYVKTAVRVRRATAWAGYFCLMKALPGWHG